MMSWIDSSEPSKRGETASASCRSPDAFIAGYRHAATVASAAPSASMSRSAVNCTSLVVAPISTVIATAPRRTSVTRALVVVRSCHARMCGSMVAPDVPDPALDPLGFLADVTRDPRFEDVGAAVGRSWSSGLRLHWAVVDLARQSLFVWEKAVPSFVTAAACVDAAVVTNGPFTNYRYGHLGRTSAHAVVDGARAASRRESVAHGVHRAYEAPTPL